MNRYVVTGRLTRDPESSYGAQSQKAFCRFRIAVNESRDKSFFINVKAWNKTAEIAEHLTKGQLVSIDGSLHQNEYDKDGKTYQSLEVWADRVEFIQTEKREAKDDPASDNFQEIQEEIPF
ncbi:MAG: single-stranded DNA-binding protein [Lachnospiraceae bacterium]|nr:single-stranded DNA-binding protein [Lachnospiraceae bacterium]